MASRKGPRECTPQERVAVMAYIETGSMTEAFKRGYPKSKLKSDALNASAKKIFRRTPVKLLVEQLQQKQLKRHERTVDRVLQEYEKLAYSDIRDVIEWGESVAVKDAESGETTIVNGVKIKASAAIPAHAAAAIASIEQSKDGNLKVKFHDKRPALDSIGKHLGMFKDQVEHTGKDGKELFPEGGMSKIELARGLAFLLREGARAARDDQAAEETTPQAA